MNTEHYFRHKLRHSLGFLNQSYGHPMTTQDVGASTNNMRKAITRAITAAGRRRITRQAGKPFPWIKWNNRPF